MQRGDRGAMGAEYAALLLLISALVAVVLTTSDLPGHVGRGVMLAVCKIFQGPVCPDAPVVAGPATSDGVAAPDAPSGTDFLAGGLDRIRDSAVTVGCMLHLCGGEQFEQSWNNAALAATVPVVDRTRVPCSDWREPAPGTPPVRPDGSPRREHTIGTFNMYGNVGHDGDPEPIVPAIVRSVDDREPLFLGLNEVCENQADALADDLGSGYEVFFASTPRDVGPINGERDPNDPSQWITCENGARFGNAIVYRTDFADDMQEAELDLESPPGGRDYSRTSPCVSSAAKQVVFCTAHLDAHDGDARETEATNLRQGMADEYAGYTTMLGGDLNDTPDSGTLDNFYDPRYGGDAKGHLKEVDSIDALPWNCREGETTHGWSWGPFGSRKKLDYVFVSDDVEIGWSDATHSDDSDHDPVWAGVTF